MFQRPSPEPAKSRRHSKLVKFNPMIGKPAGDRIIIKHGPTHAAHTAHGNEVGLPGLEIAKTFRERMLELGGGAALSLRRQVTEIVLVENHSPVLEPEMPLDLRVGRVRN